MRGWPFGMLAILAAVGCAPLVDNGAPNDDGGGSGGGHEAGGSAPSGGDAGSGDAGHGGNNVDSSSGPILDSSTGSILDTAMQDTAPPCVQGGASASLPFNVDQYFGPSGWMQAPLIVQTPTCTRPGSDAGVSSAKCWAITYTPAKTTDWAGVDWQYPANNWGTTPGLNVPAGATKVSFYAWGAQGGEQVTFNAGYGATTGDGFAVSLKQALTLTPTRYSLDLTTAAYACHSVRLGFGWVAAGALSMSFYVDSVTWE